MLLRPVMLIEVLLLVALGSPSHVLLGFLHKLGTVSGKGGSFVVAFNPHNKVKW